MSERLIGQETTVTLTLNGQLVTELTAIESSEFVFKGQAVSSDYLGQPGPVFDEVSDGVTVKIEFGGRQPSILRPPRPAHPAQARGGAVPRQHQHAV